ncbi:hypothetical protein CsSME_00029265 [Camellia sinensis var. sinensis]
MESSGDMALSKQDSPEVLPPLIKFITANEVAGFDSVEELKHVDNQFQENAFHSFSPSATGTETAAVQSQSDNSVCISMPSSPMEVHLQSTKRVLFRDHDGMIINNDIEISSATPTASIKQEYFHSQTIPAGTAFDEDVASVNFPNRPEPQETGTETNTLQNVEVVTLPVGRYFDALEGPELDTLRASEEILLPEDKQWPFLLRFPISSFAICLGVSSQAILWKTLATSASTKFLHISLDVNFMLWCISVALVAIVSFIYLLKVIFYFEAVRREYYHPIRINFFFAPWLSFLFLALGVPPSIAQKLHPALWYVLMTPIFCLEIKIYGQWMSGGQRRLSKVANPSNHLSIVGNFVGALLGASMGLKEGPMFFFAVGLAHYTVLFVTLYQRLPTNETLPKELHPVFFLFVAAPSVACVAWATIQGSFDYGSRIAYFIALFLYFSLVSFPAT